MFVNEILKYVDSDFSTLMGEVKLSLIGTRAISVQNYKKILSYSNSKIIFLVKNKEWIVEGENFKISEMGLKEIIIVGNIYS